MGHEARRRAAVRKELSQKLTMKYLATLGLDALEGDPARRPLDSREIYAADVGSAAQLVGQEAGIVSRAEALRTRVGEATVDDVIRRALVIGGEEWPRSPMAQLSSDQCFAIGAAIGRIGAGQEI